MARDRQPDLLVQILRDVTAARQPQQEAEARLREAGMQLAERVALAPAQAFHEHGVGRWDHFIY